jgi:competence protein ComEA
MFEKYKKIFAVIGSMLLIVGVFKFSTKSGGEFALEATLDEGALESTEIVVHVDGAVLSPGVYELEKGDRVESAIEKAGGLLDTANTDLINYASVLEDGQKITILKKKPVFVAENSSDEDANNPENVDKKKKDSNIPIYERTDYSILEKINYMTAEDFQAVPGIGEKISQSVIVYRDENGQFNDVNELTEVSGIGEAKLEKILVFLGS